MNIKLSITEAQYDLEDDDPKSLISALREFGCIGEWRDDYEPQPDGTTRVTMSIETRNNRLSDEEALELRAWIAAVGAEVDEGVLMAFLAGCSNPFSLASKDELEQIAQEMRELQETDGYLRVWTDHQRSDVDDALASAEASIERFRGGAESYGTSQVTGDTETWIAQDDDGYYFREVPRERRQ